MFEDNSFAPIAKIKDDNRYTLICDHIGTPKQGYDESGALICQKEIDSYGKTKMLKGDELKAAAFCLLQFSFVYVWPIDNLEEDLLLAIKSIEAVCAITNIVIRNLF